MQFDNTYARLPEHLFARLGPTPVPTPELLALNAPLAETLGMDPDWLRGEGLAMLAGNAVPEGAAPLAQAYAGHQFGHFVPRLGDGRALMLGQLVTADGPRDLVLKGSGPTPFSRRGDGRAALGPVLREYLVSEAMAALGMPTTRALAAVATGARVQRERGLPGAVLTRVARSHLRVGTFQYVAVRGDLEGLRALTDHALTLYPGAEGPEGLLQAVTAAQAELVAAWQSIGFIHGVMNTDNCAISGETLDYGPCAFLDAYHPATVFSSIDHAGRYAYGAQPQILGWNLGQFAATLLPLMGAQGHARAQEILDGYPDAFQAAWLARFRAKLGLRDAQEGDAVMIGDLLSLMAEQGADFTLTFSGLSDGTARDHLVDPTAFDRWAVRWRDRLGAAGPADMSRANPSVIPRNHQIERVLRAAEAGDMAPFEALHRRLATPFQPVPQDPFAQAPQADEQVQATFCGT